MQNLILDAFMYLLVSIGILIAAIVGLLYWAVIVALCCGVVCGILWALIFLLG